jgi:hypothetical protein
MANKFRKGINGKAHVPSHPGYRNGNDGTYESLLVEPVPEYFSRPGDGIISAQTAGGYNNNASIIFGRDRTGQGERDGGYNFDKGEDETNSLGLGSFGDYQGAGAIDIVVGRGSPFPVQKDGFTLGPLYNTEYDILELKKSILESTKPSSSESNHPGFAMDAARIYISQMTNVDDNFKITKNLSRSGTPSGSGKKVRTPPHSAIVVKADKLRMHAREDIKIVTGGPQELYNSQGEPTLIKSGIHLIAQNEVGNQQPIPLGNNLEDCIEEMISVINGLTNSLKRLASEQMQYNYTLAYHFHQTPMGGLMSTPSITGGPEGIKTIVNQFRYVVLQCNKAQSNLQYIRSEYLTPGGKSGDDDNYINSGYNTTN